MGPEIKIENNKRTNSKIETGYKPTHSRYLVYLECGRAHPHGLKCFWNNKDVIDRVMMVENGKEWARKG